jgi:hypothetical protein
VESLQELLEVVLDWQFLPLAVAMLLVSIVGSGLWNARWRRTAWLACLGLLALAFYFGIQRHEWGEVLFNGQLL